MVVDLDLRSRESFTSHSRIEFTCTAPGASTFADFRGRTLVAARLNGAALPQEAWQDGRIGLHGLAASNVLEVEGVMDYSHDGEGLHQHIDSADDRAYVYAMSFLDAAPTWFACFDQPDLKSPYRLQVQAPADWTVWGNGPAHPDGKGHWVLEQTCPLSTYFVTLCAGPWSVVTSEYDGVRLALIARRSLEAELRREADDMVGVTAACFDAYHDLFGIRYPFGDYVQAFVPDFNAGAMENPGCVTLRDQFLLRGTPTRRERGQRAGTIAHEMAHMWFGDLVTMRWWDDLWLNESFAEYMGYRVCSDHTDYDIWTEFGLQRKSWGAAADQGPNTHPVASTGALDAQAAMADFDGISYAKGAAVLHQLAAYLGDDVFLAGLRDYFTKHRFGNATLADLMAAWTRAGAVGLDDFARAWLTTRGMDVLRPGRDDAGCAVLTVTPPAPPAVDVPARLHTIDVVALAADGGLTGTVAVTAGPGTTPLALAAGPADVLVPDAGDTTWARCRPSSWDLPALGGIASDATRVVLHNALWDALRGGELSPGAVLDALEAGLPSEPVDDIVVVGVNRAVEVAGRWSAPGMRPERRARVAALIGSLLAGATPGSDRQIGCARALAHISDDSELLLAWFRGTDLPPGLDADDPLRWALVTRIVLLGGDPALIDEQIARDPSSAGRDAAAAARAAIPDLVAKQAALDVIVKPSDTRLYEVNAVGSTLWAPEQADLVAGLVPAYFAGLPGTAAFRDGWALGRFIGTTLPSALSSPETLALARQAHGTPGLHDKLRRSLADGIDLMERVWRAHGLEA